MQINSHIKENRMLTKIALSVIGSLIFIGLAVSMNKAEAKSNVYILAMGANTNGLTQANADARRFANTMKKKFKIPQRNITILKNVSKRSFNKAIKKLAKHRNKKQVYIYFSGHGAKIKGNEPDCYDEALVFSGGYNYRDDYFVNKLNSIDTKQLTTVLDTCFSGGMTKASCPNARAKARRVVSSCKVTPTSKRLKGLVLTASQENQLAWEIPNEGGRFTKELLYYINKKPTLSSAFRSARSKIIRETKNSGCYQRPQLFR